MCKFSAPYADTRRQPPVQSDSPANNITLPVNLSNLETSGRKKIDQDSYIEIRYLSASLLDASPESPYSSPYPLIDSPANLIVPFSLPMTVLLPLDGAVSSLGGGITVPRFSTAPCGAEISPERFRSLRLRLRRRIWKERGSSISSISDSRVDSRAWEMVRGR